MPEIYCQQQKKFLRVNHVCRRSGGNDNAMPTHRMTHDRMQFKKNIEEPRNRDMN